jgi:uncharacterized protein (DUF3820 family)
MIKSKIKSCYDVIPFGKYKGKNLEDILWEDTNYAQWLITRKKEYFTKTFIKEYMKSIKNAKEVRWLLSIEC